MKKLPVCIRNPILKGKESQQLAMYTGHSLNAHIIKFFKFLLCWYSSLPTTAELCYTFIKIYFLLFFILFFKYQFIKKLYSKNLWWLKLMNWLKNFSCQWIGSLWYAEKLLTSYCELPNANAPMAQCLV